VLQLLAVAIRAGNVPRVLDLLPQQTTPVGFSLLEAACCGQRDVLELLIDAAGVMPLTSTADALGRTPLHLAAANGDYGAAQLLIARGADVNVSCNMPLGRHPTLLLKLAAAGMRVFLSLSAAGTSSPLLPTSHSQLTAAQCGLCRPTPWTM
jgi:hypothetical protein